MHICNGKLINPTQFPRVTSLQVFLIIDQIKELNQKKDGRIISSTYQQSIVSRWKSKAIFFHAKF